MLDHYGAAPRACKAYRAKTKGKVERPFRNREDLNARFERWRTSIANPRVHATTGLIVEQAFSAEQLSMTALPREPYNAVLTVERRVSHEGMILAGNLFGT